MFLIENNGISLLSKTGDDISDAIFKQLNYRGDLKFRFIALYAKTVNELNTYGGDEPIGMFDAHVLKEINENPGITNCELAKNWNRTRGSISQTVSRLIRDGYVTSENMPDNKKNKALFSTEKGDKLCNLHRDYDAAKTSELIANLKEHCTMDEINGYFKVLEYQISLVQNKKR